MRGDLRPPRTPSSLWLEECVSCSASFKPQLLTSVGQLPGVQTSSGQTAVHAEAVQTCRTEPANGLRVTETTCSQAWSRRRGGALRTTLAAFSGHQPIRSHSVGASVPLLSMASSSLLRRGGAVSGGPNCSGRSGNTKPEDKQLIMSLEGRTFSNNIACSSSEGTSVVGWFQRHLSCTTVVVLIIISS